ncbi:hypothetical protein C1J03_17500 [Sulfitobacter sp. SK012]|nr:hypothetical protein C1J03_17500 [Sulfitobacter sp. SK012]
MGIGVHRLIQPDPHVISAAQGMQIRLLDWPDGFQQTCIASEPGMIRSLRAILTIQENTPRDDVYISGCWKIVP